MNSIQNSVFAKIGVFVVHILFAKDYINIMYCPKIYINILILYILVTLLDDANNTISIQPN